MKFISAFSLLALAFGVDHTFARGLKGAPARAGNPNNKRRLMSSKGACKKKSTKTPNQGAVYTMGNSVKAPGNTVVIYSRDVHGQLTRVGTADTGGLGDVAANSPSGPTDVFPVDDPLGSQNALILSDKKNCLLAVNAGSNSFSIFKVMDDFNLERTQVVKSHGSFPASIAQYEDLVYVLNAGGDGTIQGYTFDETSCLVTSRIHAAATSLGNSLSSQPFFVFSPAQISFDPCGNHLLVTNKGQHEILTYEIQRDGSLSSLSVTTSSGNIPFSFDFDDSGNVYVTEAFGSSAIGSADAGAVSSYNFDASAGSDSSEEPFLSLVTPSLSNMQTAACWLKYSNGYIYVSNNIASTLSTYSVDTSDGQISLLNAVAADEHNGDIAEPLDIGLTDGGEYLYVLNAHNTGTTVQEDIAAVTISYFSVSNGILTPLGVTEGLDVVSSGSILEGPVGLAVL